MTIAIIIINIIIIILFSKCTFLLFIISPSISPVIGMVPEPFIRIFATINRAQFESINEKYKGQQLIKDITSKLGGDFELAVLTMCSDKYEFFAKKVEKCLKGYSADKDGLCR
jgi:hypothetical protein